MVLDEERHKGEGRKGDESNVSTRSVRRNLEAHRGRSTKRVLHVCSPRLLANYLLEFRPQPPLSSYTIYRWDKLSGRYVNPRYMRDGNSSIIISCLIRISMFGEEPSVLSSSSLCDLRQAW